MINIRWKEKNLMNIKWVDTHQINRWTSDKQMNRLIEQAVAEQRPCSSKGRSLLFMKLMLDFPWCWWVVIGWLPLIFMLFLPRLYEAQLWSLFVSVILSWSKLAHFCLINVIRRLIQWVCPGYKSLTLQDWPGCSPLIGENSKGWCLNPKTLT